MTSPVDLANRALSRIGTRATIADLSENSTEARIATVWYAATRDALLRAHDWNFARRQVALSDLGSPPTGWAYCYALPADCLRFLRLASPAAAFPSPAFELAGTATGRVLYSDEVAPDGIYTARVENPTLFDSAFTQALVDQLAAHMAYPVSQKTEIAVRLTQVARVSLAEAMALNANEGERLGRGWDAAVPAYVAVRS